MFNYLYRHKGYKGYLHNTSILITLYDPSHTRQLYIIQIRNLKNRHRIEILLEWIIYTNSLLNLG